MQLSLKQLCEFYQVWAQKEVELGRLAARTVRDYTTYHQGFLAHCGDVQVDQLLALHLLQWGSSWHKIQAVQRLFNWAVDTAGLMERHPFGKVKKPRLGQRQRILSPTEGAWLLRAANRAFRQFLLAMRESIARPQEIRDLVWEEWHQLDTGEEYFLPIDFKARRRRKDLNAARIIPISPRLARLLARLRKMMLFPVGRIFLNTKGKPWTGNAVRCEMRVLRDRVGLGPDRRGERVVCYTQRHTAATRSAANGLRDRVLADLMGHSSTRTTARYQHLQVDDLLRAFAAARRKKG